MIRFEVSTEIARPPAEVFAVATDPSRLPEWQDTTLSAEVEGGGPVREGAILNEVHRGPFGRELTSKVEVATFEPARHFDLRIIEGPLKIHGHFAFSSTGTGTRIDFTGHGELPVPIRLVQPLAVRMLARQFRGYLAKLRVLLESQSV